jgi:hypothetical protein
VRHVEIHSHKGGVSVAESLGLRDVIERVCEAPGVKIRGGSSGEIRQHVRTFLSARGWPGETAVKFGYDLKVFSLRPDAAFQVQTGNAARVSTDLLKLQYLYTSERIDVAIMAVPMRVAAGKLGSNLASFERVHAEVTLFARILSLPLALIGFE